jgi:uncharacterized protein
MEGGSKWSHLPFYLCYNPSVLVDFHTHVFSPQVIQKRDYYIKADESFAALYSQPASGLATAEGLIASMDRCGIDKSVICGFGWSQQELCEDSNDYILESVNHYPERLVGLVTLQPESGDKALYEIERCVKAGIKGIGEMRPKVTSLDKTFDSLWSPIAKYLIEHGLICLLHSSEPVGHVYPGKGDLTPQILYPFIERHPGLKIILAHWGGGMPFYALMPEVKRVLANTFFDTAASSFLYNPAIFKLIIGALGNEHIIFGSDFPLLTQQRAVGEINNLHLSQADASNILGLNGLRLLETMVA